MQIKPVIRCSFSTLLLLSLLFSLAGKSLHAYTNHSDLSALCESDGASTHLHKTLDLHQDCDLFHIKIVEYNNLAVFYPASLPREAATMSSFHPDQWLPVPSFSTARLRAPPMA